MRHTRTRRARARSTQAAPKQHASSTQAAPKQHPSSARAAPKQACEQHPSSSNRPSAANRLFARSTRTAEIVACVECAS
eukprot:583373-Lingulodinium_polyedra.AAC.1